jgi:hypothetical protein
LQVAIEGKPRASSNPETPPAAPVDSPSRHAVQDKTPSCALPRSPGKLDTLLPGYTSRPFPSPRKQRNEANHSTAQQHENNDTEEGGSRSFCQTAHKTRYSREASEFQDLDPTVLASVPLPPILQRLEESFGIIAAHYEFLVQRHIQPTLKALCSAIEASVGHSSGVLQDLRLVSMLCPYVVRFESLAKSVDQDTSAIIALADPKLHKDVSNGVPASFLKTVEVQRNGCETQTESDNGGLKKKKKTSNTVRPNKYARMAWCLRVAGLRAVCSIQAEVVKTRHEAKTSDVQLTAGHWHPDFSLTEDVTKESLLTFLTSQRSEDMPGDCQGNKGTKRRKMDGKVPAPPRLFSTPSKHPPCMETTPMDAEQFLKHLCSFPRYQGRVVHVHHLPQRTAQYGTPSHRV